MQKTVIVTKKNKVTSNRKEDKHLSPHTNIDSILYTLRYRSMFQKNDMVFACLNNQLEISSKETYYSLFNKVLQFAYFLKHRTPSKNGDRALLIFNNSIDFIITFLGCMAAGVIPIPSYAPKNNHHTERLNAIIENAGASFIISHAPYISKINANQSRFKSINPNHILDFQTVLHKDSPALEPQEFSINEIALIQYTSASTGSPKGVMVTQKNILYNCEYIQKNANITHTSKCLSWLPNFHDMGLVSGYLKNIYCGVPSYILSTMTYIKSPLTWLNCISKYKITHSGAPNFAYNACTEKEATNSLNPPLDLSRWICAYTGAEPIQDSTLKKFSKAFQKHQFNPTSFYPCYGLAEATLMVTGKQHDTPYVRDIVLDFALEKNQVISTTKHSSKSKILVSSGKTILDTTILIINHKTNTPSKENEIGEIYISGPCVTKGYWNNQNETEKSYKIINGIRYVKTGDLGYLSHDKELFVTGRIKDLIIINGTNHYPSDIEKSIESVHKNFVTDGSIVFEKSPSQCVCIVELKRTFIKHANTKELAKTIQKTIYENHSITFKDILFTYPFCNPKTSSGKKQRLQAKKKYQQNGYKKIIKENSPLTPTFSNIEESSPTEKAVLNILSKILNTKSLSKTSNLLDIGANSLILFQISDSIENEFGVQLNQHNFCSNISVKVLSKFIDEEQNRLLSSLSVSEIGKELKTLTK
ncbi:hypothetical protein DID78_04515 [Candidatus Marinamargulisbacteria bacterium SCGC AG-343-D04]|nr:hypothetical protein DID78_04515 [Candidatus Marinamargulisbacteria bacterium SCGC AG-343-D04]